MRSNNGPWEILRVKRLKIRLAIYKARDIVKNFTPLALLIITLIGAMSFSLRSDGRLLVTPKHIFEAVGSSDTSLLGDVVVGVGDQNHDGYPDILVSARGELNCYLIFGGSPIDSLPRLTFRNAILPAASDVNGDSVKDLLFLHFDGTDPYADLHTDLYYGGIHVDSVPDLTFRSPDTADGFGKPFAIGDFNGDGYEDIAITAPAYKNGNYQGKVYVYFGGSPMDNIPDWVVTGDSAKYYLGELGLAAGDINGDGYSDLIIGGIRGVYGSSFTYLNVYLGSAHPDTNPAFTLYSSQVAQVVGDINGDGYNDLAVAYLHPADTLALVYFGGQPFDTIPDLALKAGRFSGGPWQMSSAGDINHDGYGDIIYGGKSGYDGYGEVLVYLGSERMTGDFDLSFSGFNNTYDGAGVAVGRSGDINGDGIDDIMFGAWNNDPGSYNGRGRVEIFGGDTSIVTGIFDHGGASVANQFSLLQNYPNPFNSQTTIKFVVPATGASALRIHVSLSIYDISGKEVKKILNYLEYTSGEHQARWDGRDGQGTDVSSGIYLYRLTINGQSLTRKMILVR